VSTKKATSPKRQRRQKVAPAPTTIVAYKGFDAQLKCRDFQYEIGQTYTHDGAVEACKSGFHACEYPLDVFNYYAPAQSRFALVEQGGTLARPDEDSKVASSTIKISGEIGLPGLIKAAIEYTFSRAKPQNAEHSTGEQGAASSTGYQGAASSTGYQGAASSTGYQGAASSTGYQGAASSTGSQGAASSTGDRGAASSTGDRGAASSTGSQGAASSTGDRGAASSTGEQGAASSTGSQGAASSTGYQGAASSTGDRGAAMACGYAGRVMGAIGNALFLVERDDSFKIIAVWAGIVGRDGIKPNTWYTLKGGRPVEVTP